MTRTVRTIASMGIVLLFIVGVCSASAAQDPGSDVVLEGTGTETGTISSPALTRLAECLSDQNRLEAMFLIDESGSLAKTDPDGQRVDGMLAALDQLRALAASDEDGNPPKVEVALAAFSGEYDLDHDFTEVSATSNAKLVNAVKAFRDRDDGIDTDYATALLGAHEDLSRRVSELTKDGQRPPCQLLVWFTDGGFLLSNKRSGSAGEKEYSNLKLDGSAGRGAAVAKAGERFLCKPGGLIDRFRTDKVITLVAALDTKKTNLRSNADLLESVAVGRAHDFQCGDKGTPSTGAYLPARKLEDLVRTFHRLITPGLFVPGPDYRLEPGIGSVDIFTGRLDSYDRVIVHSPTGRELTLKPGADGTRLVDGIRLTWRWVTPEFATIRTNLPYSSGPWAGIWNVDFTVAPRRNGKPFSEGKLVSVMAPSTDAKKVTLGGATTVPFEVVSSGGAVLDDMSLVGKVTASAAAEDRATGEAYDVTASPVGADGRFQAVVKVPVESAASIVHLRASVQVTTTSGQVLEPVERSFDLKVQVPDVYPTVSSEIRPGSIEGRTPATALVSIRGGTKAGGCVSFPGASFPSRPDGVDRIAFEAAGIHATTSDCIHVKAGEPKTVAVTFTPSHSGSGGVQGSVTVVRTTEKHGLPAITTGVPVQFQMTPKIDETRRKILEGVLLILSVLIPLVILWLINRWTGRFSSLHVRYVCLEVEVQPAEGTVRPVGDAPALGSLRREAFDRTLGADRRRTVAPSGANARFVARVPWLPLYQPYGAVLSSEPVLAAGAAGGGNEPALSRDGGPIRIPVNLGQVWAFTADGSQLDQIRENGQRSVRGTLVMFIRTGSGRPEAPVRAVVESVNAHLPALLLDLVDDESGGPSTSTITDRGGRGTEDPPSGRGRRRPILDDDERPSSSASKTPIIDID